MSIVLQRAFAGLSASAETLLVIVRVGESLAADARKPRKRSAISGATTGIKLALILERVPS